MNKLLPVVLELINKKITKQEEFLSNFGDFNHPEIIEKALNLINEDDINSKLETSIKNLTPELSEFVNIDVEAEICILVADYFVLKLLRQADKELKTNKIYE